MFEACMSFIKASNDDIAASNVFRRIMATKAASERA